MSLRKHEITILAQQEAGGPMQLADRCTLHAEDTKDAARRYAKLFGVIGSVRTSADPPPAGTMDIQIQYHASESMFAAGLMRDGQPWTLDGACVGMGATRMEAVADLLGIARALVIRGTNRLMGAQTLPLSAREWLYLILQTPRDDDAMYAAMEQVRASAHLQLSDRTKLVEHLHSVHGGYPAGHDFMLRGTADLITEHQAKHGGRDGAGTDQG